jgi:hypothetical protein
MNGAGFDLVQQLLPCATRARPKVSRRMSELLQNHLAGRWTAGTGAGTPLFDPVLGDELVRVDATGLDLATGFSFAREQGGARPCAR